MNNFIVNFVLFLALLAAPLLHASPTAEVAPSSSLRLASPTLEIEFPVRHSLVQFFYVPSPDEEPNIEVYLSYRSGGRMETVHLETMEPEGRAAEIESVFTLDADGDKEKELFVVAAWPIGHAAIGTEGTFYRIYVYRKSATGGKMVFQRVRDIEEKLGSGLDGVREGVKVSFPYKDYESIRTIFVR